MSNSRFTRALVVPAVVVGALVAQAGLASPALAAGQRYASPTGAGTFCTSAAPCALATAVNSATAATEVIVAPGTYELGATGLANSQLGLNVHGVAGQPRPVINSSASTGLELTGTGAKVADLTINHTGAQFGLNVFASNVTVQRVEVHSTAPVACFLGWSGLARDTLCVTSAAGGVALDDSWGSSGSVTNGPLTLRNITAVATGPSSYGIRADAGDFANIDIGARNVIAWGTFADVRSTRTATSSDSDVVLSFSNYDTMEELGGGDVAGAVTNQAAPPIFLDTTLYHQASNSPTVDKGSTDSSVGTADLDGDLRRLGVATDIGADEFDTIPPDVAFVVVPKQRSHRHKVTFKFVASEAVTFTCKVDKKKAKPCSSPFKVKMKRYGKHLFTVSARDLVGNVDPAPATYGWKLKHKHKRKNHHHHHHH